MANEIALTGASTEVETTNAYKLRLKQVAMLWHVGRTVKEIATHFKVAESTVENWLKEKFCQDIIAKFLNSDLEMVKDQLRDVLPDMVDRMKKDIKNDSSPDSYKAIDKVCKIFGFFNDDKPVDAMMRYKQLIDSLLGDDKKEEDKKSPPPIDVTYEEVKD